MTQEIYDIVGVGFGPGNIAVAVALEEMGWTGSCLFLEKATEPGWQAGMLLPGMDTQHHPLRDFATPRNPRSRFGFLSYLHAEGRFFDFLNLGLQYPLRSDYAGYVKWVARHFDHQVSYGEEVVEISVKQVRGANFLCLQTRSGKEVWTRSLVFAPGRSPYVPEAFKRSASPRVVHLNGYLPAIEACMPD